MITIRPTNDTVGDDNPPVHRNNQPLRFGDATALACLKVRTGYPEDKLCFPDAVVLKVGLRTTDD